VADAYWSDVSLLLNFVGSDGSTEFFDENENHFAITTNGDAQIQSNELLLDGTGDYLSLPNSTQLLDSSGPLTIEALCTFDKVSADGCVIFDTYTAGYVDGLSLYQQYADLRAIGSVSSSDEFYINPNDDPITVSVEAHVALTRNASGEWKCWVDGTQYGGTETEGSNVGLGSSTALIGLDGDDWGHMDGTIRALRVTNGTDRYTGSFTPPTALVGDSPIVIAVVPSPLGAPAVVTSTPPTFSIVTPTPLGEPAALVGLADAVRVVVPSPLGPPAINTFNDFSALVVGLVENYVMRITGTPETEIPMSSWQATLQTDRDSYVQAVVPNAAAYSTILENGQGVEEFVIYRVVELDGVEMESEMARADLTTIIVQKGPYRATATISGYTDSFSNPISRPTVTLTGVRSSRQSLGGGAAIRADIDWFLRPGQDVTGDDITITTDYISYYVTNSGDSYMEAGTR